RNYALPFAEYFGFKVDSYAGVNLQVDAQGRLRSHRECLQMRIRSCVVFALLAHAGLWAQTAAVSQISGTVQDPSGAAIAGAVVRVTQTETGFTRTADTGTDGVYRLPELPVGPYKFEATKQAFGPYVQTGIVLQVNINPT